MNSLKNTPLHPALEAAKSLKSRAWSPVAGRVYFHRGEPPTGLVHISKNKGKRVGALCKKAGIQYAPAMVSDGFFFTQNGIVVPAEFKDAVLALIQERERHEI